MGLRIQDHSRFIAQIDRWAIGLCFQSSWRVMDMAGVLNIFYVFNSRL